MISESVICHERVTSQNPLSAETLNAYCLSNYEQSGSDLSSSDNDYHPSVLGNSKHSNIENFQNNKVTRQFFSQYVLHP